MREVVLQVPALPDNRHEIHSMLVQMLGPQAQAGYLWVPDPVTGSVLLRAPQLPASLDRAAVDMVVPRTGEACGFGVTVCIRRGTTGGRPVTNPGEVSRWLERQARAGGFWLHRPLSVVPASIFVAPSEAHRRAIRLQGVTISGRLQVTDDALFLEAMRRGLGRSKAYGLGLLQVF